MKRVCAILLLLGLVHCGGSASPSVTEEAGGDGAYSDSAGGAEATSVRTGAEPGIEPSIDTGTTEQSPGPGSDLYGELVQASIDLDNATTLAAVDCTSARDLRDRICDLSSRICEIASDNPDDRPTADRCADGRARCEGASDRVAQSCP